MNRNTVLIIVIVALAGAGFFIWDWKFRTDYDSFEFAGTVKDISGDILLVNGVFVVADNPRLSGPDNYRDVKIRILPEAKITKTLIYFPDPETLGPDRSFNTKDLKKENVEGAKEEIAKGLWITVKSGSDIFGKSKFSASEINYTAPIYP